jgi:predicted transporter
MSLVLLIAHGLAATALLGALTHQAVAVFRLRNDGASFLSRYASVRTPVFRNAVIALYGLTFVLGALIYPAYRVDARIALEEMHLDWVVGLFEIKEHFGGIGLAVLPLYAYMWDPARASAPGRMATTLLLASIVWFDFFAGHLVNNIRGL